MSIHTRHCVSAAAVLLSLTLGPAAAQESTPVQVQVAPSGLVYVSGGIGDAQQGAMQQARNDYTLRLTFARPQSGAYLADVRVRIEDATGKGAALLDAVASGPMLYARLADGRYQVHAEHGGRTQSKAVTIAQGRAQELVFYFSNP